MNTLSLSTSTSSISKMNFKTKIMEPVNLEARGALTKEVNLEMSKIKRKILIMNPLLDEIKDQNQH